MDVIVTDPQGTVVNTVVVASVAEAQAAYPGMTCVERVADAAAPGTVSKVDWLGRFTAAELAAINAAVYDPSTNIAIRGPVAAITQLFSAAPDPMRLDDPRLAESLAAFTALGFLADGRAAAILAR